MPVIIRLNCELMCTYMLYIIGAKVLISTSIFERGRIFFDFARVVKYYKIHTLNIYD